MLENGALETLYLNECHLSDGAAAGLLRSANSSANPSLRSLHLSRNSCAAQVTVVFRKNGSILSFSKPRLATFDHDALLVLPNRLQKQLRYSSAITIAS